MEGKGYFSIISKALLLVSCMEYGMHTTEEFNLTKKKELASLKKRNSSQLADHSFRT